MKIQREISSSIYAVSQIAKTRSTSRKAWWIFVLVVGLFGSGWQITTFLSSFLQYPVAMGVKMDRKFISDFPAVTICNLNRMNSLYMKCMDKKMPFRSCESVPTAGESGSGSGKSEGNLIISERRIMSSCSSHFSGIEDESREAMQRFLGNYIAVNSTERERGGYELEDFIKDCSIDGKSCKGDFSYTQNLRYGNCFTFKKEKNSDSSNPPMFSHMGGLIVTLNISKSSYLPITSNVGARVIIHDSVEDPSPEEKGINISPGFETSISISQRNVKRLPAPYRDRCSNYGNDRTVQGKRRNECVRICIQRQNFATCSCVDPTLSALGDQKPCDMTNSTEACCLDKVLESMTFQGLPCKCPLPCLTSEYRLQISRAALADRSYDTQHDVASFKIHYSNLQSITFIQKPMFETSELFGNLGGHLSLWLGLSLFAAFELLEYFAHFFFHCFQSRNLQN